MALLQRRTKTSFRASWPSKVTVIAAAYILMHVVVGAMLIQAAINMLTTARDDAKTLEVDAQPFP